MKTTQKCIRMSDRACKYIDDYRGGNFTEKLENFILDHAARQDEITAQWNRAQAEVDRRRAEYRQLLEQIEKLQQVHYKLKPLLVALDNLLPDV